MLFPYKLTVAPFCLTRFRAKEFLTLRVPQGLACFVSYLVTNIARHHFAIALTQMLALGRTINTGASFNPKGFYRKLFLAVFANPWDWHTPIIARK